MQMAPNKSIKSKRRSAFLVWLREANTSCLAVACDPIVLLLASNVGDSAFTVEMADDIYLPFKVGCPGNDVDIDCRLLVIFCALCAHGARQSGVGGLVF